ncbi:MAG TPA: hypothetical protein VK196_06435 [Magnetospirillum sp.]|nr:hypothetical protein [Magnetospirillum sp.]
MVDTDKTVEESEQNDRRWERKPWIDPTVIAVEIVDSTGNNGGTDDEGFGSS